MTKLEMQHQLTDFYGVVFTDDPEHWRFVTRGSTSQVLMSASYIQRPDHDEISPFGIGSPDKLMDWQY